MVSTTPISMASRRTMSVMRDVHPQGALALSPAQEHGHGFDQAAGDAGQQVTTAGHRTQQIGVLAGSGHDGIDHAEKALGSILPRQCDINDRINGETELAVQCCEDQLFLV